MNLGGPESLRVRTEVHEQRGGPPFSERCWGLGDGNSGSVTGVRLKDFGSGTLGQEEGLGHIPREEMSEATPACPSLCPVFPRGIQGWGDEAGAPGRVGAGEGAGSLPAGPPRWLPLVM